MYSLKAFRIKLFSLKSEKMGEKKNLFFIYICSLCIEIFALWMYYYFHNFILLFCLKTKEIDFFTVLEDRCLQSRCGQALASSEMCRGESPL